MAKTPLIPADTATFRPGRAQTRRQSRLKLSLLRFVTAFDTANRAGGILTPDNTP